MQETAAAVGVTAASKAFFGLSGPVRAMILLNLGSALFGSNQVQCSKSRKSDLITEINRFGRQLVFLCFAKAAAEACLGKVRTSWISNQRFPQYVAYVLLLSTVLLDVAADSYSSSYPYFISILLSNPLFCCNTCERNKKESHVGGDEADRRDTASRHNFCHSFLFSCYLFPAR